MVGKLVLKMVMEGQMEGPLEGQMEGQKVEWLAKDQQRGQQEPNKAK